VPPPNLFQLQFQRKVVLCRRYHPWKDLPSRQIAGAYIDLVWRLSDHPCTTAAAWLPSLSKTLTT
jgi:hypothetical protein